MWLETLAPPPPTPITPLSQSFLSFSLCDSLCVSLLGSGCVCVCVLSLSLFCFCFHLMLLSVSDLHYSLPTPPQYISILGIYLFTCWAIAEASPHCILTTSVSLGCHPGLFYVLFAALFARASQSPFALQFLTIPQVQVFALFCKASGTLLSSPLPCPLSLLLGCCLGL